MPRQQARAAALAVVLAAITPVTVLVPATVQAKGVRTLEVEGPRVTLADVLPSRPELASVDLGVAPPAGGSRLITKKHIRRALDELAETGEAPSVPDRVIPATVRITRKAVRLDIERQKELVGQALRDAMPHGSEGAVRFVARHGEADADHAEDLARQIEAHVERPEDHKAILDAGEVVAGLYLRMFRELGGEQPRWS